MIVSLYAVMYNFTNLSSFWPTECSVAELKTCRSVCLSIRPTFCFSHVNRTQVSDLSVLYTPFFVLNFFLQWPTLHIRGVWHWAECSRWWQAKSMGDPHFWTPVAPKPLNRFWWNLLPVITSWTPTHMPIRNFRALMGACPHSGEIYTLCVYFFFLSFYIFLCSCSPAQVAP